MDYILNLKEKNEIDPVVFEALSKDIKKKKRRNKTKKRIKKIKNEEINSENSSNNNNANNKKLLNRRRSGILITNDELNKIRMKLIDNDLSKLINDKCSNK